MTNNGTIELVKTDPQVTVNRSLDLSNGFTNNGMVRFGEDTAPETIRILDDLTIGGTGTIRIERTPSAVVDVISLSPSVVLTNGANHTIESGLSFGKITLSDTSATLVNEGTIRANGGPLQIIGGAFAVMNVVNNGVVDAGSFSVDFSNVALTNANLMDAGSGTISVSGNLINTGTITTDGGTISLAPVGSFNNAGNLLVQGGSITVSSGTLTNAASGVLGGFGTINVSGASFVNAGSIRPGLSAGILNITGDLPVGTGSVGIEIGGLVVGSEYDQLNTPGIATLDTATLNISLVDLFQPNLGDTFTIMTFGSHDGEFAVINGLDAGNGLVFEPTYHATSLVLTVALP